MKLHLQRKTGNRGDGVVQYAAFIIGAFVVIALFLKVAPVFVQKQQLDTFANEVCRTAAISGRVGDETNKRTQELKQQTNLSPDISWSSAGNVQLGQTVTVTLKTTYDIGFGGLGSYPVQLKSEASGKSEVYWK
jgi:hypothetical protein